MNDGLTPAPPARLECCPARDLARYPAAPSSRTSTPPHSLSP